MRKLVISVSIGLGITIASIGGLIAYGRYLDYRLRNDIQLVNVGMSEADVIRILGEPSNRGISDLGGGAYWSYDTDLLGKYLENNPHRVGYLVLEMGHHGRVVKVFELK